MKKSVTLRRRLVKGGKERYYLDYYLGTKINSDGNKIPNRKTERLDIYHTINPKDQNEKKANRENEILAEKIVIRAQNNLNNDTYDFKQSRLHESFLDYFEKLAKTKDNGIKGAWYSSYTKLTEFCKDDIAFEDIDSSFIVEFREYLKNKSKTKSKTGLHTNTASTYFKKFKAAIYHALREDILKKDPFLNIDNIKEEDTIREYLTQEELQKLIETEPNLKGKIFTTAFIFSCLTGLRFSDIQKLEWSEIELTEKGAKIVFKQQKTKSVQYHPINEQALTLLREKGLSQGRIFKDLVNTSTNGRYLKDWVKKAGITKKISFHCARHTHATLLLTNDVDIYIIMEILGHKNVQTTQIYTKIISQKRDEAVNKIPTFNF